MLFAVSQFADLVKAALAEKINLIISGAGFSRDMFGWGQAHNIPIVPVVSSARLASMAEKLGAAAVVVEGKEAGGHLGTDRPLQAIIPEVLSAVKIPVIAAGGIIDGQDIARMLKLGASGVQMGTRFAACHEANASDAFKQLYVDAGAEDVTQIKSPVGLPGQALRNAFCKSLEASGLAVKSCHDCLKRCNHYFCIMEALVNASRPGLPEKALVFCGEQVHRIKSILSVGELFTQLRQELAFC